MDRSPLSEVEFRVSASAKSFPWNIDLHAESEREMHNRRLTVTVLYTKVEARERIKLAEHKVDR